MVEAYLSEFVDKLLEEGTFSCDFCKELLVAPIMLVPIGNVCNSCYREKHIKNNWTGFENKSLETILNGLHLPCKFKINECKQKLLYKDVKQHELTCKHRPQLCPMSRICNCIWRGNIMNLVKHFSQVHQDHVIKSDTYVFSIPTSLCNANEHIKLLTTRNDSFILKIQVSVEQNRVLYVLCNTINENLHEFTLILKGNNKNCIILSSTMLLADAIYQDIDDRVAVKVPVEVLQAIVDVEVPKSFISILKVLGPDQQDVLDEKLLPLVECPVCKCFMKPPIFQCSSGHPVCNVCRPKLLHCHSCRVTLSNIRNIILENLTYGVLYECVYQEAGCPDKFSGNAIMKHEKMCPFRPYSCPIPNCSQTGDYSFIKNHLQEIHHKMISSGTAEYKRSFSLKPISNSVYNLETYCLVVFDQIFRLTFVLKSDYLIWAVEVMGDKNKSKSFVCEITVFNEKQPKKKIIRTDYCLQQLPDDILSKRSGILIQTQALTSFLDNTGIANGALFYNVRIIKI